MLDVGSDSLNSVRTCSIFTIGLWMTGGTDCGLFCEATGDGFWGQEEGVVPFEDPVDSTLCFAIDLFCFVKSRGVGRLAANKGDRTFGLILAFRIILGTAGPDGDAVGVRDSGLAIEESVLLVFSACFCGVTEVRDFMLDVGRAAIVGPRQGFLRGVVELVGVALGCVVLEDTGIEDVD